MTHPQCGTSGEPATTPGWCLYASQVVLDDASSELQLVAYRSAAEASGQLDWTSTQQVGAEIVDQSGHVVWRYRPVAHTTTHSESVLPSRGIGWGITWRYLDDAGHRLQHGQYTLRTWCTARQLTSKVVTSPVDVP